jgi:hypothetical protein
MDTEDKLIKMFNEVHGELEDGCSLQIIYRPAPVGVRVWKGASQGGYYSKEDLLFDYITRDWG